MTKKYELSRALDLPAREAEVIERFLAGSMEATEDVERVQDILRRWFISRGLLTDEETRSDSAAKASEDARKPAP